jgi:hypothetical protein
MNYSQRIFLRLLFVVDQRKEKMIKGRKGLRENQKKEVTYALCHFLKVCQMYLFLRNLKKKKSKGPDFIWGSNLIADSISQLPLELDMTRQLCAVWQTTSRGAVWDLRKYPKR